MDVEGKGGVENEWFLLIDWPINLSNKLVPITKLFFLPLIFPIYLTYLHLLCSLGAVLFVSLK